MPVHRDPSIRAQYWRNRDYVDRRKGPDGKNTGGRDGNGGGNGVGKGGRRDGINGKGIGKGGGIGNQNNRGPGSGKDGGPGSGNDGGPDSGKDGGPGSGNGGGTGGEKDGGNVGTNGGEGAGNPYYGDSETPTSSAPATRTSAQSQSPQLYNNGESVGNKLSTSSTPSGNSASLATSTTALTSSPPSTIPIDSSIGAPMTSSDSFAPSPSESNTQAHIPPRSQLLSKGATAGIVISILFVVAVIVLFLIRLRNQNRRREKMEQSQLWWFGSEKSSEPSGSSSPRSPMAGRISPEDRLKIQSMRSSFGTNIDRGLLPSDDVMSLPLPAIAEIDHDSASNWSAVSQNPARNSYLAVPTPSKRDSQQFVTDSSMNLRPFSQWQSLVHQNSPVDTGERSVTAESGEHRDPAVFIPVTETIRRPYFPSSEDELRVVPGNIVNVVKPFEDGWCFCEIEGEAPKALGLIPMDCLRNAGEPLPASLTRQGIRSNFGEDTTGQVESTPSTA